MAGSGPAGPFVALTLGRRGVRVLVLDKGEDVDDSPRAMAFQLCAVAEMMKIGIYDDVKAACIPDAIISWWRARTDGFDHKYLATISTRDSVKSGGDTRDVLSGINIGQDVLTRILLKHLARHSNAEVQWKHAVVDLTEIDGQVRVTYEIDSPTGGTPQQQSITTDWLFGADGDKSMVRKRLPVDFEGFT